MKNEVLINLRKERKLTQQQLANAMKVSVSTIGMMESGDRKGSIEILNKLADFFEVSLDYLTGATQIRNSEDYESRKNLVSDFLKFLVSSGVITDSDNIDKKTHDMILNMVKKEIELLKKGEK